MEIKSKIHVEQPAPPGVHWRHSDKRDIQTDKKTHRFGRPGSGWNPSPTKLGMVIEDLEHVLAPRKIFGVRGIVSLLRDAENLVETQHHQLKTP